MKRIMKEGDLIITNLFGESHKICLILDQYYEIRHGHRLGRFLILLPCGKKKWFPKDALLTMNEYEDWNEYEV